MSNNISEFRKLKGHMGRWRISLFIAASIFSLGCQRQASQTSTITIRVPKAANMSRKSGGVGSMAALPSDRKSCYAVSVTGPGITMSPSHICAPPTGLRAGFVEPGAMIEMQVPKGKDRKIELFAFLQSPGQDLPCPVFAAII